MDTRIRKDLETEIDTYLTEMSQQEVTTKFVDSFYEDNMSIEDGQPWTMSRDTMDALIKPAQVTWDYLRIKLFLLVWQQYLNNEDSTCSTIMALLEPTKAKRNAAARAYNASHPEIAKKRWAAINTVPLDELAFDGEVTVAAGPSPRATSYDLEMFYTGCMEAAHWYASSRDGIRAARNTCSECPNVAEPESKFCEECISRWDLDRYLRL